MSMPYSSSPRRKVRYSRASSFCCTSTCSIIPITFFLQAVRHRSVTRAAHEAAHVQNQCHTAVTHDGGARNIAHLAVVGLEVLDHHLLLSQQFSHQQCDTATFGFDDDHDAAVVLPVKAGHVENLFQLDDGHVLVTNFDHAARATNGLDHVGADLEAFNHRRQRQDVDLFAHAHAH